MDAYFPEKVTYVVQGEAKHTPYSRITGIEEVGTFSASRAYVCDSKKKATIESAKKNLRTENLLEFENNSFAGIKLVDWNHSRYGARGTNSFQALVNHKYLVDLDEEILLDIFQNTTITNGEVDASFLWASIDGRITLIREGSAIYNKISDCHAKKFAKNIKPSKLEIGCSYKVFNSDERHIFLGWVDSDNAIRYYSKGNGHHMKITPRKRYQLWYSLRSYWADRKEYQFQQAMKDLEMGSNNTLGFYNYTNGKSIKEKMDLPAEKVPDNLIELISKTGQYYEKLAMQKGGNYLYDVVRYYVYMTTRKVGDPLPEYPEVMKILEKVVVDI